MWHGTSVDIGRDDFYFIIIIIIYFCGKTWRRAARHGVCTTMTVDEEVTQSVVRHETRKLFTGT